MLAKQRRPDERQVGETRVLEHAMLAELFLRVADADECREAGTEEAEREAGRVLVGVEPDDERAERRREHGTGDRAGAEREPVVAGVDGGREAGDRRDQHHPFGAEVDDAGALVDQEAERSEREHGAGVQRRRDQERELLHQVPSRAGSADDDTTGLSGASSIGGGGALVAAFQRSQYAISVSHASSVNSSRPWKTPVSDFGKPSRDCASSPPM